MTFRAGILVFVMVLARPALGVDVTQCGQIVPSGETGVLQGNLVCPRGHAYCTDCLAGVRGPTCHPFAQPCSLDADCPSPYSCEHIALGLDSHATLDLNGFSITGAPGDEPDIGVACTHTCALQGPGDVGHFAVSGVQLPMGPSGTGVMRNFTVHDNGYSGLFAHRLRLENVTVTANGTAPQGVGIWVFRLRIDGGLDASGNGGTGILAYATINGGGVTANANGTWGVYFDGRSARIHDLTATGNGQEGVFLLGPATLEDSTITGNDGAGSGLDVFVSSITRPPRLIRTTCGKSNVGICAND